MTEPRPMFAARVSTDPCTAMHYQESTIDMEARKTIEQLPIGAIFVLDLSGSADVSLANKALRRAAHRVNTRCQAVRENPSLVKVLRMEEEAYKAYRAQCLTRGYGRRKAKPAPDAAPVAE